MEMQNVYALPLAANVCEQLLREVDRLPTWSVVHVLMNPRAWSLYHAHPRTDEVYVITRGSGDLVCDGQPVRVQAGDVIHIPAGTEHMLTNAGMASLEHLVLASPPFDPTDLHVVSEKRQFADAHPWVPRQREPEEAFDGARILSHRFGGFPSIAFGWVTADPERRKAPHHHLGTTEWVYVVEGRGTVEVNGAAHPVGVADWIRIDPGERHALRTESEQHMVVVCLCSPQFDMADVHYD